MFADCSVASLFNDCMCALFFFNSPPVVSVAHACVQLGNPLWVNHVNRYHELIMISLIKYMALYNIPLVEEDACEMFRKLAVATARDEGRDLTKSGRWNGKRNEDGTATGNYATEIVCGSHFFRSFLERYPMVKNYRTSSMSIMRAKKATYEVFIFPACSFVIVFCIKTYILYVVCRFAKPISMGSIDSLIALLIKVT